MVRRGATRWWATLVVAVGVAQAAALADTVHLRDGRELSGYIIEDHPRSILIVGSDGVPMSVPRHRIEWVAYVGDAGVRTALRQALVPEVREASAPSVKRAATPGNRGYLGGALASPTGRSSRRLPGR